VRTTTSSSIANALPASMPSATKPAERRRGVFAPIYRFPSFSSTASSTSSLFDDVDGESQEEEEERRRQQQLRKDEAVRDALDRKTGRLWSDPWDLEEVLSVPASDPGGGSSYDDLPEWSPDMVSRVSQERLRIFPSSSDGASDSKSGKKKRQLEAPQEVSAALPTIPSLSELAALELPPPPLPHPGLGLAKAYALQRKRRQYEYVLKQVNQQVRRTTGSGDDRIKAIEAMEDWDDKQDAVDELFEELESELRDREPILGKHPQFGYWVERALEECLRRRQQSSDEEKGSAVTAADTAAPLFVDLFNPAEDSDEDHSKAAPKIVHPLQSESSPHKDSVGRMVEEWELAAHKRTKRIMLRQCTKRIAAAVLEGASGPSSRILVSGRQGVGKTAAVAAVVASARISGYVVLYVPYGDQFRKNGYYIEPNLRREGIYDLPVLSQQVCTQFLDSHGDDLRRFSVDRATLERYFTDEQMENLPKSDDMTAADLLQFGSKKTSFAPMCYAAAVDVLMEQSEMPFLMVFDEFNCYYEQPGHYFHMSYDKDARKSIPYDQISLFKPALDAMALSAVSTDEEEDGRASETPPSAIKRGAILVATTESHAVSRRTTDGLVANAKLQVAMQHQQQGEGSPSAAAIKLYCVDVPRLSALEVEHMLANYEATGVGKLRMDRGETVMNDQEVQYLRMVSEAVPQKLLEACII